MKDISTLQISTEVIIKVRVFEIKDEDRQKAIETAVSTGYAGKFLMMVYEKIIPELTEEVSIDPNLVYIRVNARFLRRRSPGSIHQI